MKILQVNCVYQTGSTGKIVADIHTNLQKQNIESVVCYGRGAITNEPNIYKTSFEWYAKLNNAMSRINGIMYGGCFFSTNRLISVIKKEHPDIVHLHCINGYFVNIYHLIEWLRDNHIKTVLTLHAEFMYTGGCGHSLDCDKWRSKTGCGQSECPRWRLETKSLFFDRTGTMWKRMKEAFDGFNDSLIITSVSPWLMERARQSSILREKKHQVILNGLDTDIFHPYNDIEILKQKNCITSEKIIFHVTANFSTNPRHIKGGYYVLELARRLQNENVKILVAGPHAEGLQLPDNIVLLGKISNQHQLARYYSMANVTLLTSQKETFSMVTAESLCCGTPVVGFKAGAPEQIAISEYSSFVEYGNIDNLLAEVTIFLKKEKEKQLSSIASQKFSVMKMINGYVRCYLDLLGDTL